jgi:hypothetical protein
MILIARLLVIIKNNERCTVHIFKEINSIMIHFLGEKLCDSNDGGIGYDRTMSVPLHCVTIAES